LDVILNAAHPIDSDGLSSPDRQLLQLAFVYFVFELSKIDVLRVLAAGINQLVDQERTQDD